VSFRPSQRTVTSGDSRKWNILKEVRVGLKGSTKDPKVSFTLDHSYSKLLM